MKKNQLIKDVSNVNDVASQVVSSTAGLKGNIKNISVKNNEKNVESIAEKAFKAAIIDKTNVDTTENGQFHTAYNLVDNSLLKTHKAGATVHRTTKKIALSVVVMLIDKHLNTDSGGKDETFSDKGGYDNYSSTELQPMYQHDDNRNTKVKNDVKVSYKKVGNSTASIDGEFIDCDVIDTDTLVVNYNGKIIECKLEHMVNSDVVNAEDINMSTIIVSDYNGVIPATSNYNISEMTTTGNVKNIKINNLVDTANSVSDVKKLSELNKANINIRTNINSNVISNGYYGGNTNNINSIIEKNKIKKTNSSVGTMMTRTIVAKDVAKITQNSEKKGITNEKLKARRQKLNSKKEKLNDKPKSSTAANDLRRMVRKQIVNEAIDSFSSENENNMSSGMASLAGNYVAAQAEKKVKEKTVDKLYDATIGKAMDKVKSGIKRAFKGLAQSIIHFAFMLFQLIVSVIGALAALIGPMILLPVIIGAVLVGGVFGGIFHLKLNDEEAAKNDSDIRQVIEENEDIFGKFSFDKSSVANLGTFQKSYDELKAVFTWMDEENPYPVKDQARIITSQYTLKRTDVEGHAVHYGVDFNAPMGSTLVAIADATVVATNTNSSYGNHVILDFGDGTYALYAHMTDFDIDTPKDNTDEDMEDEDEDTEDEDTDEEDDEPRSLQPGDTVKAGDMIGHSGSTGDSTGPHLHLVLSTSPYGNEADSRYDFNEFVKNVWCPDFEFSYDYEQTYGIFENDVDYFREN